MALKFGRSTVKTTDPKTGARIADPEVYGKETLTGKVSSWPEVREMYKAGKLKKNFEGRQMNQDVMDYLSGTKGDKLSDVEYDEPIIGTSQDVEGSLTTLETNYKKGGKKYKQLEKQAGAYHGKIEPGTMRVFSSDREISDVYDAGGGSSSIGTDLDTYRKPPDPLQKKVDPPLVQTQIPVPPIKPIKDVVIDNTDTETKLKPLKPTKITEKKLGKLRQAKEEDLTWDPPKFVKEKGVRVPMTKLKKGGKSGVQGAYSKVVGGIEGSAMKYNTEKRRSAAYYGDNTSTGEKITGKTESELRQLKKETRGEGGRMLKEGRLGSALTIGKDLSQIRKATRYAKDADLAVYSKTGLTMEGQGSNLSYFTPERARMVNENGKLSQGEGAMAGYKDYKTQEKGKVFRAQYENATNRNTIANQLKTKKK